VEEESCVSEEVAAMSHEEVEGERTQLRRRRLRWTAGLLLALLPASRFTSGQQEVAPDYATCRYAQTTPNNAISQLQARIDSGEVKLDYAPDRGYLPAVLRALNVPVSSQTLVFSKTSVQKELISPQRPRALYFNDRVYVGYVPTGPVMEFAAVDPQLGAVYYNLLQRQKDRPRFFRNIGQCMECHGGKNADHLPVHLLRSVYPDAEGVPYAGAPNRQTTDATPFKERWGGWYVTGAHGGQRHMGNSFAVQQGKTITMDFDRGANVVDLRSRFDTSPYLSPHSDIVALLVMEHQTRVQNLITRANYETNCALLSAAGAGTLAAGPSVFMPIAQSKRIEPRIAEVCEPLVRALLFVDEAPLTAPVSGTSGFAAQFQRGGPCDRKGRSLRQLDLRHRLLRYPCSYLIYSEAYEALPRPARDYIVRRLRQILSGRDHSPDFARLSPADRIAIREILQDTRPDFAMQRH
jgi:hypothetical protein